MFMGQGIPHTLTIYVIAIVGTVTNAFSFDAVSDRDTKILSDDDRVRYVMSFGRNLKFRYIDL